MNLEDILKVLSDRNRLRIIKLLERQTLCVCEIAYVLGIKQPSVSRHLKKLKAAGLICEEQDSFWTNYILKVKDDRRFKTLVRHLSSWLEEEDHIKEDIKKLRKADRTKLCCR